MDQDQNITQRNQQNIDIRNSPSQSSVSSMFQADRIKGKKLPLYKRVAYGLDIFSFMPIPKSKPVSSKCSIIGSMIFIIIMASYAIFSFVTFLTSNSPKASQYYLPVTDDKYESPQFAVGFFWGDAELLPFDLSDGEYFTLSLQQQVRTIGEDPDKTPIPMAQGDACKFDWLGPNIDTKFMYCPDYANIDDGEDGLKVIIQGNAQFDTYMYPQVLVQYCKPNDGEDGEAVVICKNMEELQRITSGGRIMLYLQKGVQKDFVTGKVVEANEDFTMYYYFLVPGLYVRNSVNYVLQKITQHPNLFTRFTDIVTDNFWIDSQTYYPSKTVYDKYRAFSVWLTLTSNITVIEYNYSTFIVWVSLLGALFNVVFGLFSVFFLGYNQKKFYNKNEKWADVSGEVGKVKQINQIHGIDQDIRGSISKGSINQDYQKMD